MVCKLVRLDSNRVAVLVDEEDSDTTLLLFFLFALAWVASLKGLLEKYLVPLTGICHRGDTSPHLTSLTL